MSPYSTSPHAWIPAFARMTVGARLKAHLGLWPENRKTLPTPPGYADCCHPAPAAHPELVEGQVWSGVQELSPPPLTPTHPWVPASVGMTVDL